MADRTHCLSSFAVFGPADVVAQLRRTVVGVGFLLVLGLSLGASPASAALGDQPGRNETRVYTEAFLLEDGLKATAETLVARLERLGYERVQGDRPKRPGQYFWGVERFWIYRNAFRYRGVNLRAELIELTLDVDSGRIAQVLDLAKRPIKDDDPRRRLEPELMSEALLEKRAVRRPVKFEDLPEHVWKPLLAAEDHRFFEHSGVDARGVARAMLSNALAGKVVQGGSTITQQLVKLRDLSPKRTFTRKISEAVRAVAIEAENDKEDILEAYLNYVYYGHLEGVHLYGIGAAAHAFYGKRAEDLSLSESVALAAIVQGPNRMSPVRRRPSLRTRWQWVFQRMVELEWLDETKAKKISNGSLPRLSLHPPEPQESHHYLGWLRDEVTSIAPKRMETRRGVVIEGTIDPLLQTHALAAMTEGLATLRKNRDLRSKKLTAALVALDARSGRVLAYVGGDPADRSDAFDRGRRARRQPGSTIKPLVLMEAFERCGSQDALYPAQRVSDRPVTLDLPSGAWSPENSDDRFEGTVTIRHALVDSRNVPFVRIARHCGFDSIAERLRSLGYPIERNAPPSFVLGAVETSPINLARSYVPFANGGRSYRSEAYGYMERPQGRRLAHPYDPGRRVTSKETAWLVRDLMIDSVERGTAKAAAIDGLKVWAKTGTSSERRDAWLVGGVGSVVTAVWVGIDDGEPLGLTGSAAAAPIWKRFMEVAAEVRPELTFERPDSIEEFWIDPATGLRARRPGRGGSQADFFRAGTEPRKKRLFRRDEPVPVIE